MMSSAPAWVDHGCLWEVECDDENFGKQIVGRFYREEDAYRVYNALEDARMDFNATYGITDHVYNVRRVWGNNDPDECIAEWGKRY